MRSGEAGWVTPERQWPVLSSSSVQLTGTDTGAPGTARGALYVLAFHRCADHWPIGASQHSSTTPQPAYEASKANVCSFDLDKARSLLNESAERVALDL